MVSPSAKKTVWWRQSDRREFLCRSQDNCLISFCILAVSVAIALVIHIKGAKTREKIDKGFSLSYWNLSYRRKFIRTLWSSLLIIPAMLLVHMSYHSVIVTIVVGIVLLAIFTAQAVYNYMKWKKEKCD